MPVAQGSLQVRGGLKVERESIFGKGNGDIAVHGVVIGANQILLCHGGPGEYYNAQICSGQQG